MRSGKKKRWILSCGNEFWGYLDADRGEPFPHYEAINDSVVLKIPKIEFALLLKSIPKLAVSLSQSLSHHIHKSVTRTRDTQESTIIAVYAPLKGSGSSTYATNLGP